MLLRTAFVPTTAQRPDLGRDFLDFLISEEGQQLIEAKTGFARIDEAALALRPIRLDAGLLIYVDPLKKAGFLNEWSAAVVRR